MISSQSLYRCQLRADPWLPVYFPDLRRGIVLVDIQLRWNIFLDPYVLKVQG
jgi:hypothetical protein